MAIKRIAVSEARKQKLYEAVTASVMILRVEIAYSTFPSTKEKLDKLLYDLQLAVGKAAIESIEQPLK